MWKAVLVLFMTSNIQPVSTFISEFPKTFMSKTECQSFIAEARPVVDGILLEFAGLTETKIKVLRHALSCMENTDGEPI